MNLRDVEILVALVDERYLQDAAHRLSISVSQLRESLLRLERVVGTTLVADCADEIELTAAGAGFVGRARRILRVLRVAAQEVQFNTLILDAAEIAGGVGPSVGPPPRPSRRAGHAAQRAMARATPHRPRTSITLRYGDVQVNLLEQTVSVAGEPVSLTRKEFQLLALIAAEGGGICPRERLIRTIWHRQGPAAQNTLNVHVRTLRAKLDRPDAILTLQGIGYRMADIPILIEPTPSTPAD